MERKSGFMISIEEYKNNPCKVSSLPYWKAKTITVPANLKVVHSDEFASALLEMYDDKTYFRFKHDLKHIPECCAEGFQFGMISPNRFDELTEMINRSYTHSGIRVSTECLRGWTATPVYCPQLWIGAYFEDSLIGSILCDHDREVGEGIVEWLQVVPEYRNRGIASALVCSALRIMRDFADFATVSGECDNITFPEKVYRKCGFTGNDVWHILCEKGK